VSEPRLVTYIRKRHLAQSCHAVAVRTRPTRGVRAA
jgi:hypothetical protein